jgi:hypothetical protein
MAKPVHLEMQIGSDIIRSYKRLAYSPWHAIAEFVDNSTQSYFNNRAVLDAVYAEKGDRLEVRVVYARSGEFLRISDTAMGMDLPELQDALTLGKAPPITTGRSQFGLGMKTAACWFGDEWTIKTKKLGEDFEHEVTIEVEEVADGKMALQHITRRKARSAHYTVIEIRKLHAKLQGRRLGYVKEFLSSMYRVDIRNDILALYWSDTPLSWDEHLTFLTAVDGSEYKRTFEFTVKKKKVWGWVGILGEGSRGRPKAGLSIIRRGRVVKGHPAAYRPEAIFGEGGRNDLINQRLTGEINLDDFEISHTKDDILWRGTEEDDVQDKLREKYLDFIKVAREWRRASTGEEGPTQTEVQAAVDELRTEMESKEFVDIIQIQEVPPPKAIEAASKHIIAAATRLEPRFSVSLGKTVVKAYLSTDGSPFDPYYVSEITKNGVLVVANQLHPHWGELEGSEGVLNYLRHCVYDAVAEWQCTRNDAAVRPETIKLLKDQLLRLPSQIDQL